MAIARKAGQMISRGNNKWLLRWFVGKTPEGKRKYASKVFTGTTAQARRELSLMTAEVASGEATLPTRQTVQQYLTWWLDHVAPQTAKSRTRAVYRERLERDVFPRIGHLKLSKVHWQHIQEVYTALTAKGQAFLTVLYLHRVLKHAFSHALEGNLIKANPCSKAYPAKEADRSTSGGETKDRFQVWSAPQVQEFLRWAYESNPYYALWYTLLKTGLRPGELCGLKWSDLDGSRLSVQRTVTIGSDRQWVLDNPKTAKSRRALALTEEDLTVLREHRREQLEDIMASGPDYQRLDFMFPMSDGTMTNPMRLNERWSTARKGVEGLPAIRLYDLRHTHATLLLKAGVHPKVVSERLGHSTVAITLDTYSHVLPDMQDEAAAKLQVLLGNS